MSEESNNNSNTNGQRGSDKTEDLSMTDVRDPNDTDVLCGRGGAALRHPGNQTYRRLVNLNKGLYITCLKTEKLKISRSIVAAIREQNGRFLEKDAAKGTWIDIGDKKAIEKTSQALREGQPKLRQKIVEMGGGAAGTAALIEQQFGANGVYQTDAAMGMAAAAAAAASGGPCGPSGPPHHHPAFGNQNFGGGMPMMPPQHAAIAAQAAAMGSARNLNATNLDMPPPPPQAPQNATGPSAMQTEMFPPSSLPNNGNNHNNNNNNNTNGNASTDMDLSLHRTMQLRPSLVKRGSAGIDIPSSQRSLMSDFSAFGGSSHHVGESSYSLATGSCRGFGPQNNITSPGGASGDISSSTNAKPMLMNFDRRTLFANSKYHRRPSTHSLADGMPDIHMVESSPSIFSSISGRAPGTGVGSDGAGGGAGSGSDLKIPSGSTGTNSATTLSGGGPGGTNSIFASSSTRDLAASISRADRATSNAGIPDEFGLGSGSRHSIMSGLSRISDNSEVHSIFSDLSRKIGNVSTRSIAMSEISGIDEQDREEDDSHTFGTFSSEPRTTAAGAMDFDW